MSFTHYTDSHAFDYSSWIVDGLYDEDTEQLFILTQDGRGYVYDRVPVELWREFTESDSPGSYFNSYIKGLNNGSTDYGYYGRDSLGVAFEARKQNAAKSDLFRLGTLAETPDDARGEVSVTEGGFTVGSTGNSSGPHLHAEVPAEAEVAKSEYTVFFEHDYTEYETVVSAGSPQSAIQAVEDALDVLTNFSGDYSDAEEFETGRVTRVAYSVV